MILRRLSALLFLLIVVPLELVRAQRRVNRTIDDQLGDSETGARPRYVPRRPGPGWNNETCLGCAVQPDRSRVFRGTYSETTWHIGEGLRSVEMSFDGIAIWVFFILANADDQGPLVTTATECEFILDDNPPVIYKHTPDLTTQAILYAYFLEPTCLRGTIHFG
ncbi:hypothetical protein CC2G_005087 [Coprinopsis cinerea AmutBmut pab1-1]|nr:hypothetical protein CC2G_005087 [Coprinopsis cinerea AmutBmut pab1-1]